MSMNNYTQALGQEETEGFDVQKALQIQSDSISRILKTQEENLRWRRIATYATVAGAFFALIRLSDIYFAVKRRRASE